MVQAKDGITKLGNVGIVGGGGVTGETGGNSPHHHRHHHTKFRCAWPA